MNVSTTGALSVAAGAGLAGIPASQRLEALAVLVLLVGVIQLLAGLFRLGFLIRFVSNAVMTGFLNGVAVLIILGQLGDLTGFRSAFSNNVVRSLDLLLQFGQINVPTTIIGVLTLARHRACCCTRLCASSPSSSRSSWRPSCWRFLTSARAAHGRQLRHRRRRSAMSPRFPVRCPNWRFRGRP